MMSDLFPTLNSAELAWLWPKFQRCSFPPASFPKRFARNDLSQLSQKGKTLAARVAYQYRRQIFKGSAKWTSTQFIDAVKRCCARDAADALAGR